MRFSPAATAHSAPSSLGLLQRQRGGERRVVARHLGVAAASEEQQEQNEHRGDVALVEGEDGGERGSCEICSTIV